MVTLGVDAHKRTHTVVAVDEHGGRLGQRTVGTTTTDHLGLLRWAEQFDGERRWAVEDCRHPAVGAGPAQRGGIDRAGAPQVDGPCSGLGADLRQE